jgi:hypothetical protein
MSRALKPQKVKVVEHPTLPIKIEIMLDRDVLDFFFEVAGRKIRAADIDEADKLARENLSQLAKVEWEAVIEIDHSTRNGHRNYCGDASKMRPCDDNADLELRFERYERGKFDGQWKLKRKHVLDVEPDSYEMRRRTEQPHAGDWYGGHGTIIPYTKEAWAALRDIVTGVHVLNKKLDTLLGDERTASRLLSEYASRLLSERLLSEYESKRSPALLPPFVPYDPSIAPESEQRHLGRRRVKP